MKNTLIKTKIVLEDNKTNLVLYVWEKSFLWFGYWRVAGSSHNSGGLTINKELSKETEDLLFKEIISKRQY